MSRAGAIVSMASGRRIKWAILVFWLIIVAVLGPLAGKLTGAEKNDSSAWLPAKAEFDQGPGRAVAVPVAQHLRRCRGV